MEVIYRYTRKDAIEDGVLVGVTSTAKKAGINWDTAMTCSVWNQCVVVPKGLEGLQDESGRLWDILVVLHLKLSLLASSENKSFTQLTVPLLLYVQNSEEGEPELMELHAVLGPGDDWEPTITVMFPGED